jgi:DNA polymerase-3 subunit epsilon/ATP-dependent DNA helicase DinG
VKSIVALDIETTGLDSKEDSIIEIGAVRFNGRRVEGEWSSLVNPGRRIPPFITQLTGITDQMVLEAPPIRAILSELQDFVGDSPILGHNVGFDVSFLRRQKILVGNDLIDTYEMASVLMPSAGRYNLSALGQALNVPLPATHRALDDARVTRAIFLRLFDLAHELPLNLLAEIVRLSEPVEWSGYIPFYETLRERSKETFSVQRARPGVQDLHGLYGPLFDTILTRNFPPLNQNEVLTPLDPDEVASILEHGGPFSRHFPSYEYRPQQVEMLRSVVDALSNGRHLLVEAGTGTGKSMAYMIPAALWALQNNARVVVSTNTINLQDQLINKDIPDLCAAIDIDLRFAVLKGRSNYICPRRLENLRRRGPQNEVELRVLGKVLIWLQSSQTGDRNEINLNGPNERDVWMRISAEDENCSTENCIKRGGICPFYRARQAAYAAHVIVVNHALLLADVATGNRVIPEYDYLILDEAHHMEDATTNALSYRATQSAIERTIEELGGSGAGVLGRLLVVMEETLLPSDYAQIYQMVQRATDLAFHFQNLGRDFFSALDQFLFEQREGRTIGIYAHQERILPATRTQPAWGDVEVAWDEAEKPLKALLEILAQFITILGDLSDELPEDSDELFSSISSLNRRLSEFYNNVNGLVFEPNPQLIYWIEINPNGRGLALNTAPLHIGPLMQKYIWNEKSSVILTSATLTAAGEFDYLRARLFAEDAYELALGSPFDYETATLLYFANDIPEPNDRSGHQRAVEQGILQICHVTGGRALVLFTSYDQLKRTSQAISPLLAKEDIRVYEQGEGASANTLLEHFRNDERAVLLGTRAFWEGVDVPGEALSVLIITKLPFDVPSDPIVSARAETFDDPFQQYSLPEAILRFRQGFGRLIRTKSDRGIVAILDKRVLTKRYGKLFLDSLPTCTVQVGPLNQLPRIARQWLNL